MGKRTSRATGSGKKVFSASSASTSAGRPKAGAGAAEHYAFRKAKASSGGGGSAAIEVDANPLDIYSLEVGKHKRANVTASLSRDEEAPGKGSARARRGGSEASDADGDDAGEDGAAVRERLRKLVNSHELLELEGGSDDEELDSDDAFEDDDEGRGWGAAFVQKQKSAKQKAAAKKSRKAAAAAQDDEDDMDLDVDLSENDGPAPSASRSSRARAQSFDDDDDVDFESDEAGSEGFVDLSTFLLAGKGYAAPSDDDDESVVEHSADEDAGVAEDDEGMDLEDDEASGEDEEESDEDLSADDDDDAQDKLTSFISALPSSKRKASDDEGNEGADGGNARAKRRVLRDRNEEGRKEGSFGAPLNAGGKLSLQTLLAPLPAAQSSSLLSSTKALAAPNTGAALPAPLPSRAQDKLEREAAYEATKNEVHKWDASMRRIRQAEHLSFPLQAQKAEKPTPAALTAKFQPKGDFESAVANLIQSAQMGDDAAIAKREEMAMSNLTKEEVAARRAELAHMRELMFRAETKAKRVAKIKSKTYRKIARKEADRTAEKLAEAGFGEDEDELRIKKDRDRAIERATLKHKNTGKWAKAMLNKADELDVDQRRELNEQLQEGERLTRRIQGRGDNSSDDDDSSDDDGGEQDLDALRERAFAQIDRLDPAAGADDEIKTKSGLFQMKFMTDARKRAAELAGRDADDFRREMDRLGAPDGEGVPSADEDDGPREAFTTVGGNAGRQVFGQGAVALPKHVQPPASDASTATLQSSHTSDPSPSSAPPKPTSWAVSTDPTPSEAANPWLTAAGSSKQSRKKNAVVGGRDAVSAPDKANLALKKSLGRAGEAREREADDALVDIDPAQVAVKAAPASAAAAAGKKALDKGKGRAQAGDSDSEDDDGAADHERKGPLALRQRDLVAQAFAGDNVLEDFAEEKRKEEDRDKPREVDTSLPGWGSWGGRGVKKAKPNKKHIKHVPGLDVSKRKDFAKSHVVISERKDKKADRHTTKDLPYPFTSRAQYEASLRTAVGPEWATRATVQKLTMPRVVTKMGTVLHPLEKQF